MSAFDLDRIGGRSALAALVDEVLAAGAEARRTFEAGRASVTIKPDRSPVTIADEAIEKRLFAFLRARWPEHGLLGEETGASGASDAGLRWVLDPIDGTRAFVRGISTWSVLLGLEDAGEPVIGVAYLPAEDDLYVAVRGEGAYRNGRRLSVSRVSALREATVCHGALQQFRDTGTLAVLPRIAEGCDSARGFMDFDGYRRLARGEADAMVDPGVKAWDICAAAVIVREAGGELTSMRGERTVHGGSAIASNGLVHAELVSLIAPALREVG